MFGCCGIFSISPIASYRFASIVYFVILLGTAGLGTVAEASDDVVPVVRSAPVFWASEDGGLSDC